MGWTHSSDWGKFSTTKGKVIKIKLVTITGYVRSSARLRPCL
jgi:hypothetical protein